MVTKAFCFPLNIPGGDEQIYIDGVPKEVDKNEVSKLHSRLVRDVERFVKQSGVKDLSLRISTQLIDSKDRSRPSNKHEDMEEPIEKRANRYSVQQPSYSFSHLIVDDYLKENLLLAVNAVSVENTVFNSWGLREIQPNPCKILNFYGSSGTGKTLAAHAIADYLEKPILTVSYADVESKFHGDGPKNLKAMFYAAEREKALLFVDEADSLLSERLIHANTGSEQATNSMRSQLLICLEQFNGIAIFATNLVESYDKAFDTRVHHLHFPMPSEETRLKIWRRHLPEALPLSEDVSLKMLAKVDNICGRDIREAVIDASSRAALRAVEQGRLPEDGLVTNQDLHDAVWRRKKARTKGVDTLPVLEHENFN